VDARHKAGDDESFDNGLNQLAAVLSQMLRAAAAEVRIIAPLEPRHGNVRELTTAPGGCRFNDEENTMLFWSLPEIFARAYADLWFKALQPRPSPSARRSERTPDNPEE
jgi:hypothetical protein